MEDMDIDGGFHMLGTSPAMGGMLFPQQQQQQPPPMAAPQDSLGPPEIGAQEVEKFSVLGDGSFGTVYRGRCRAKDVAVKVLHKQDLDQKTLATFRQEVQIVRYHPTATSLWSPLSLLRG